MNREVVLYLLQFSYETQRIKCGRWIPNEYLRRGLETMADRRKKGSGSVRERSDGRWEGRVIVG